MPEPGAITMGNPVDRGLLEERALLDDLPQVVFRTDPLGNLDYVNRRWVDYAGLSVDATLGGGYRQAFHPEDLAALKAAWRAGLTAGAAFHLDARVRGRDGVYRWFAVQALPHHEAGRISAWAGTLTDVHEAHTASAWTRALHTLAVTLAQAEGTETVLQAIVSQTASASGAIGVLLAVPTPDGNAVRTIGSTGLTPQLLRPWREFPSASSSPLADALRTGQPLYLHDEAEHDTRYPHLLEARLGLGLSAAAALPLNADGKVIGALFLAFPDNQSFARPQGEFLQAIAAECARALTRTRFVESQVQAREAAEQASAFLESLLANLPVGWAFLDRELRFRRVNPILAEMNGASIEAHLGRSVWEVLPKLREAGEPMLRQVLENKQALVGVPLEGETPAQPGVLRQWEENIYPVLDANGRVIGLGVLTLEVTERAAAQRAVNEERERLALAVDAGGLGVWEWDLATNVRTWAGHHGRLLGLPADTTAIAMPDYLQLVHPDDRAALLAAYDRAIRERTPYQHEYRVIRPDGSVRWLLGQGRTNYDDAGRPMRMRGTLQDITERREIRERLARLNDELEARVRERTNLLEERTTELEERNAELETFLHSASHDLRTPLVSILGMAEVLAAALNENDAAQAAFALARVTRNAQTMNALLDSLLNFARAGRHLEASEEFDLGEVTRPAAADLWAQAARRGLRIELPDRWPRVCLPRAEAEQVITNLLSNAIKFATSRVRVTCNDGQGCVCLSIEDDGPGIAPADRERVFDLFRKLDPSREGAGVGLAVVKRVVERHGGSVTIDESHLGGAAFTVTLPQA